MHQKTTPVPLYPQIKNQIFADPIAICHGPTASPAANILPFLHPHEKGSQKRVMVVRAYPSFLHLRGYHGRRLSFSTSSLNAPWHDELNAGLIFMAVQLFHGWERMLGGMGFRHLWNQGGRRAVPVQILGEWIYCPLLQSFDGNNIWGRRRTGTKSLAVVMISHLQSRACSCFS